VEVYQGEDGPFSSVHYPHFCRSALPIWAGMPCALQAEPCGPGRAECLFSPTKPSSWQTRWRLGTGPRSGRLGRSRSA
jgi:hypothetical protein